MYHFTKLNVYFSSILLQKEDKTWQLSTGNVATLLADFHVEKEIVRKETELAILEFYLGEINLMLIVFLDLLNTYIPNPFSILSRSTSSTQS